MNVRRVTRIRQLRRLAALGATLLLVGVLAYAAMFSMPGESYRGPLPLLTAQEEALAKSLRGHVEHLAGRIGERNVYRPQRLAEARAWIEDQLRGLGYAVTPEEYKAGGVACANLVAEVQGGAEAPEIVVVGAHYDSVVGTPGANDNASGVAALLEIARALRGSRLGRTLRLAAFVNEEPPFFQTEAMGSLVHARAAKARGENIVAMLSLETLGYYTDAPASQSYPPPFSLFYPSVGNFISFVGNIGSRNLVRDAVRAFRETTQFPSEGGAPWGGIPGVGWSDHWSFWQAGYPGLMVTDTAPFRYPHYHAAQDRQDKLDYEKMARVVSGLVRVVQRLAGEAAREAR